MKFSAKQKAFLQRPQIARIAVIDNKGYPHSVPIWYSLDGNDLMFFSSRSAKKIDYIQGNAKGAVCVGGDPYGSEGYLIKGEFSLEEDQAHRWLSEITHRYETKEVADKYVDDWGRGDLVLMRFKPNKVSQIT